MTTPAIPQHIRDLASHLEEKVKLDGGKFTFSKDTIADIIKTAPESVRSNAPTIEELGKVFVFESNLVDAVSLVAGNVGEKAMKEDKKLDRVTITLPITANKATRRITATFDRDGSSRSPRSGEVTEYKGALKARVTAVTGASVSSFKDIQAHLRERAMKSLA